MPASGLFSTCNNDILISNVRHGIQAGLKSKEREKEGLCARERTSARDNSAHGSWGGGGASTQDLTQEISTACDTLGVCAPGERRNNPWTINHLTANPPLGHVRYGSGHTRKMIAKFTANHEDTNKHPMAISSFPPTTRGHGTPTHSRVNLHVSKERAFCLFFSLFYLPGLFGGPGGGGYWLRLLTRSRERFGVG